MVCADSGPVVTAALDFTRQNPHAKCGVITRFKCYFRADTKVFEPPVVDLHKADVMRKATGTSLADDGQSAGAGTGAVCLSGNVDTPWIEAGFRLGDGKDEPFGYAIA